MPKNNLLTRQYFKYVYSDFSNTTQNQNYNMNYINIIQCFDIQQYFILSIKLAHVLKEV